MGALWRNAIAVLFRVVRNSLSLAFVRMSSDEEEPGRAASYSARLSSFGTEGRRSSFGAKLADDISAEGGPLDMALAMSPIYRDFNI